MIREARVKVGLSIGAHHVSLPFDRHFLFGQETRPVPARVRIFIPRDSSFGRGTLADVRTGLSLPLATLCLLLSLVTQPSSSDALPRRNRFKRYFSRDWVFQLISDDP